ncbi:membrane protein [Yersinia pseudotuberculosis]|nr:membrane protein [Yersinia pseudotuberculosis]
MEGCYLFLYRFYIDFFGSTVDSLSVRRIILGIRNYLDATRYLIDNPKILDIGQGIENGIVRGARFCIVFSATYRSVESLLKDEYGLADFFVNLTLDAAKPGVSIGVAWGAKALATGFMVAGTGVIFIAAGIFLVGFGVSLLLYWLDNEYKISETIIKNIKTHRAHNTPYHPDQLFSAWGRFSRG